MATNVEGNVELKAKVVVDAKSTKEATDAIKKGLGDTNTYAKTVQRIEELNKQLKEYYSIQKSGKTVEGRGKDKVTTWITDKQLAELTANINIAEKERDRLLRIQKDFLKAANEITKIRETTGPKVAETATSGNFVQPKPVDINTTPEALATEFEAKLYAEYGAEAGEAFRKAFDATAVDNRTLLRVTELFDSVIEQQEHLGESQPKVDLIDLDDLTVSNTKIIQLSETLSTLNEKKAELEAAGAHRGYEEYDTLIEKINIVEARYNTLASAYDAMYQKSYQSIGALTEAQTRFDVAVMDMVNSLSRIANVKEVFKDLGNQIKASLFNIGASIVQAAAHPLETIKKIAVPTGKFIGNAILTGAKGAANAAKGIVGAAAKGIGGVIGHFKNLGKSAIDSADGAGKSFKKMFTTVLKVGLGVRGTFALFRKLRTIAVDAVKTLASQSSEFNAELSQTMTAWTGLKGAIGSMLQPLVSAVLPTINTIIGALTDAATAAAKFIAALTGQNYIYKATAANQDYAKSAKKTGKAAKDASKDVLGFDELNKLSDNKDSDDGGTQYAKTPLDTSTVDLVKKFKAAWDTGDFTKIGEEIAGKIAQGLNYVNTWITTTGATYVNKIASSLGTLLNGIVSVPMLAYSLGSTIASAINTAVSGINQFYSTVNWQSVGSFLALGFSTLINGIDAPALGASFAAMFGAAIQTLGSFLKNFDWVGAGNFIVGFATGFFNTLTSALKTVEWRTIADNIYNAIVNVDWGSMFDSFFTFLGTVGGGLSAMVAQFIGNAFSAFYTKYIEPHIKEVQESGGYIITGILAGIWDAIKDIYKWIYDHVFKPFKDAFCEAFGISSPSKEGETWGGFIVEGILNGLGTIWEKLTGWVDDVLLALQGAWESVSGSVSGAWEAVVDIIGGAWTTISEAVGPVWETITTTLGGIWESLTTAIGTAWGTISETTSEAWSAIVGTIGEIFGGVKDVVTGIINSIIGAVNGMISGVCSGINAISRTLNAFSFDIPSWVPVYGGSKLSLNLPELSAPQIPYLAQGAVIPPNREFMAMLGDQKYGNNIETPENLLRQIVREESGSSDLLAELLEELISTVAGIKVGDDVIGRAATRYQRSKARMGGVR